MKPSLPTGTRDFSPETVRKRMLIFNTIRDVFELYGFQPLETPAMENLETLMGKYGEEGDKLIFKILNNGLERTEKHQSARAAFENVLQGRSTKAITERALKYDLTIPFARYVAMNHGQLSFPFKRYQLQPVWRADKPQKGRYREFYQCDADVVGSKSLLNEAELALIYMDVFTRLKMDGFALHINSRKILKGLMEANGVSDHEKFILMTVDKLDKIGMQEVHNLLSTRIPQPAVEKLMEAYALQGDSSEKIKQLKVLLNASASGMDGIADIESVLQMVRSAGMNSDPIKLDITLARGLDYYTGIIYEAKAPSTVTIGSIGGGGRYDDLTGLFGVPDIPGVGISFGVDRIFDVMEELRLFPEEALTGTRALFFNLGEGLDVVLSAMHQLRAKNIAVELFHEPSKFDKQFRYAEKKKIPYAVIIGSKEISEQNAVVKDLRTGQQVTIPLANLEKSLFI